METIKLESLDNYEFDEVLNPDFESFIMSKINLSNDKFTIAREIYICLCKTLRYDEAFIFYLKDSEISLNKYNLNIENVSKKSNEVTCLPWAKIYVSLLRKLGIEAIISGDYHKHVVFKIGDMLVKADATKAYRSDSESFVLNDCLNVSLGYPTIGFTLYSNDENFDERLFSADEKISYASIKFDQNLEKLKQIYGDKKDLSFEEVVEILNKVDKTQLIGIERYIYLNSLCRVLFSKEKPFKCEYLLCEGQSELVSSMIYYQGKYALRIIQCTDDKIEEITIHEHFDFIEKYNPILFSDVKRQADKKLEERKSNHVARS